MPDPQSSPSTQARQRAARPDDAIDLLLSQHRQLRRLFDVYGRAKGEDKKETAHRISDVLILHSQLEEEIFYPAVRRIGSLELGRLVDESLREHHAAKQVLLALSRTSAEEPDFERLMQQLEDDVMHHIEEEESEMLPQARGELPELEALAKHMATRLDELNPAEIRSEWVRKGKIE